MADLSWKQRYGEAIITGLITAAILGCAGFIYDAHPTLFKPFAYFLVSGVATLLGCLAVIALKRIPKPPPVPDLANIESYVRDWLDSYGFTVMRDPSPLTHFRFRITLPPPDSEDLTIFRMNNEQSQYVNVYTDLSMTQQNFDQLQAMCSQGELEKVLYELKMELARSKVGYSGLVLPPLDFKVFKRVLIHESLRETDFFSAITEVESAHHLVSTIYRRLVQEKRNESIASTQPESVSYIPELELPPASS